MGNKFLWAFSFLASATAFAADPPPSVTYPDAPRTYVPQAAAATPGVQNRMQQAGTATGANAAGPTNIGSIPTPDSIPAPTAVTPQAQSLGQYRNARGDVNISKMFLDRYKQSVVRVISRDLAGNELSRAMGVGVGRNAQYIATTLSIVLGNTQQWADTIEITHAAGNKYNAKVALIDEEKNLVLLAPEANPAPLPYAREQDERAQVTVYFISFDDGAAPNPIIPKINHGKLAATNTDTGLLSVAPENNIKIEDEQAGTALLNSQGELLGMLLPGGRGVLSSTLQKLARKADLATPIDPNLVGTILGRGVLVGASTPGAFPTIAAALEAIKKGDAPKADPSRYTPARNRAVAPKESDKVVIKVLPGTYKETKLISIPSNISLSGSGPDRTTLLGTDPEKPVVLLQNSENSMLSGFRIVPAPLQSLKAPTVIISKGRGVTLLGNVIEAKGGVAVWAHDSMGVNIFGNAFARGQSRGVSCDRSDMVMNGNAFVGDWPMAVSVDKNCSLESSRNLFFENKIAITISALAKRVSIDRNTFIRSPAAVKITGSPTVRLNDNLFFEGTYGLLATNNMDSKNMGRNAVWRAKLQAKNKTLTSVDIVRTEPRFVAPTSYDFRLQAGQAQFNSAQLNAGDDLGAFQRDDLMGEYTQQLVRALAVAVGNRQLPVSWGFSK